MADLVEQLVRLVETAGGIGVASPLAVSLLPLVDAGRQAELRSRRRLLLTKPVASAAIRPFEVQSTLQAAEVSSGQAEAVLALGGPRGAWRG